MKNIKIKKRVISLKPQIELGTEPISKEVGSVEIESFKAFKTGFVPLARLYPKQGKSFKDGFKLSTGVDFCTAGIEHFDSIVRIIMSFTKMTGVSFYKETQETLEGWGANVMVSPVKISKDKMSGGIVDADFSQAALLALKSSFQHLEHEML
jgi:hypothetical protein